jgi:signal transduction histidine kinase
MGVDVPPIGNTEFAAAVLQTAVALTLALLSGGLFLRYRKAWLGWMALAWAFYVLRLGIIISFLVSRDWDWLYWHQVITGWTALALLWAACVFSGQTQWRRAVAVLALFPLVWSWVAIYRLDHFLWAALPAVAFLSAATLWAGWVFLRHHRRVGGAGALVLAGALLLWGLHHLDYPFLRARGAWSPWGYYLDVCFLLAVGLGVLLLLMDDLQRGLNALAALSGELQRGGDDAAMLDALLAKPLSLPAVTGSAIYRLDGAGRHVFARGAGACRHRDFTADDGPRADALAAAIATGRPQVLDAAAAVRGEPAYTAVLPIFLEQEVTGALLIVGEARDPFTALDEEFLVTLGQHVGAALANAELDRRLEVRTEELGRLSAMMLRQHEEERRRLSRELHDETAQVFSAVKMELGMLRETAPPAEVQGLDHVLSLVDSGIRAVRRVTANLRPSLLDDLGLLPALRSLVAEFAERSGLEVSLRAADLLPPLGKEAELAVFRALQEALANVARHAGARRIAVDVGANDGMLRLVVEDDGIGPPPDATPERLERSGHLGLAGMRERIGALGGGVRFARGSGGGARLDITLPVTTGDP